ncbi:hypothetical protein C1H46_025004 [Malus baccata]|uniref:Uncharacterized protein n=1 Tax=Malus baccata TaxID=106549 RepID=A0A540LT45_MALBA|nr:hypothetical protein C1H46_025004 [Malus baccata]
MKNHDQWYLSGTKPTGSSRSFFFEGQVGIVLLQSWLRDQASHVCIFPYGLMVNTNSNFDVAFKEQKMMMCADSRKRDLSSSWSLTRCEPSGRGSKKKDPVGLGPERILSQWKALDVKACERVEPSSFPSRRLRLVDVLVAARGVRSRLLGMFWWLQSSRLQEMFWWI